MKRRKIFLFTLTLIMSMCFVFSLVGCNSSGNNSSECSHEWQNMASRTEPTCTTEGNQEQQCTKCNEVQIIKISALGHDFAESWTSDENAHWHVCTRNGCTQKADEASHEVASNGHNCDTCGEKLTDCADENNDHNCDTCGEKISDHIGGTATCVNKAVCTICGNAYGNFAEHNLGWVKGKDGHYRQCQTENCTEAETLAAHTFEEGICSVCGDYDVYGTEDLSFNYYARGDYYEVNTYKGTETDIVIPYYYNDGTNGIKVVNKIVSEAFGSTNIKSIIIPDSVTIISYGAFRSCLQLESIIFGENSRVNAINGSTFNNCWKLTSFHVPDSVTQISSNAFLQSGIKTVTFGENSRLTTIGDNAFASMSIKSIKIPDSVTTIEKNAFTNCVDLRSVTLGAGLTAEGLGANIFTASVVEIINNSKLNLTAGSDDYNGIAKNAKLIVNDGVSKIKTDKEGCTYLIAGDQGYLLNYGDRSTLQSATLPETLEGKNYSLAAYSFNGSTLRSIKLPQNLISIDEGAFSRSVWLNSITIPETVTLIGKRAFYSCARISSITIPANVTSIGEGAFYDCTDLTRITVAEGSKLTSIGKGAFRNCKMVTSIVLPDGVTAISEIAFQDCVKLESVTIGKDVTSIGNKAFYGCSVLTIINFAGTTEQWQAITKGTDWKNNKGEFTVVCSDGSIAKADA